MFELMKCRMNCLCLSLTWSFLPLSCSLSLLCLSGYGLFTFWVPLGSTFTRFILLLCTCVSWMLLPWWWKLMLTSSCLVSDCWLVWEWGCVCKQQTSSHCPISGELLHHCVEQCGLSDVYILCPSLIQDWLLMHKHLAACYQKIF